jgi:hypothetical protein
VVASSPPSLVMATSSSGAPLTKAYGVAASVASGGPSRLDGGARKALVQLGVNGD